MRRFLKKYGLVVALAVIVTVGVTAVVIRFQPEPKIACPTDPSRFLSFVVLGERGNEWVEPMPPEKTTYLFPFWERILFFLPWEGSCVYSYHDIQGGNLEQIGAASCISGRLWVEYRLADGRTFRQSARGWERWRLGEFQPESPPPFFGREVERVDYVPIGDNDALVIRKKGNEVIIEIEDLLTGDLRKTSFMEAINPPMARKLLAQAWWEN